MAVRYAVATGNWSSTSTWNGGTLPTSADDVYANGFTVTIDQNVTVLSIQTTAQSPAVAGGGFVLNSGLTINVNGIGIRSGSTVCITYSATSGITAINGNIFGSTTTNNAHAVNYTGAANLNINGNLTSGNAPGLGLQPAINKTGTGTLTVVGNLNIGPGTNSNHCIVNSGTGTINITGNLYGQSGAGSGIALSNTGVCTINITGDIYAGSSNTDASLGLVNTVAAYIYITGNIYANTANPGISSSGAHFLSIVGVLSSNQINPALTIRPAVASSSSSAINLFSGPFISSPYGSVPYQCFRMHLIPSASTYLEFRDETTNGVISPGAIAPATRMVAPASVVDAPAPANVRFGTIYANGSQTGTCKIPATTAVAAGVGVDNTVGSAVLSPGDVWNALVSTMSTSGSIGERLKNASTVQTTGEQIASIN